MIRFVCVGLSLVLGLGLAVIYSIKGQPISGLALAISAFYVAFGIVTGITINRVILSFNIAAVSIGFIYSIAVFTYSRGLNLQLMNAHVAALEDFTRIDLTCPHPSVALHKIQIMGIKACAVQNDSDLLESAVDLGKALHLGPMLSIIDSAISLSSSVPPDYCAVAFKKAEKLCPSAFISLSTADREVLTNFANIP